MATITTQAQFQEYCLRRLGKPILDINVSVEQVEDRVDDALKYWYDYHYNGTTRILYQHVITETDITNKYITMPETIHSVVRTLPIGGQSNSASGMFNAQYQLHLNEAFYRMNVSILPYFMAQQHVAELNNMLIGGEQVEYNEHTNKLYIFMGWSENVSVGDYIICDGYQITDPVNNPDVWNDHWLQRYATVLIKRQWGENLSKFVGLQLPGGVQFDGTKIYDEAVREIGELEKEMQDNYVLPAGDLIG